MNRRRSPVPRTLTAAVVVPGCAFVLLLCSASHPSNVLPLLDCSASLAGPALAYEVVGGSARQRAPAPIECKEIVTGRLSMIADDPTAAASNTADLVEVESAQSSRQGELDRSVSQKNYLAYRIDLSTLTISFTSEAEDAGRLRRWSKT